MFWLVALVLIFSWLLIKLGILSAMAGVLWTIVKFLLIFILLVLIGSVGIWLFKKMT